MCKEGPIFLQKVFATWAELAFVMDLKALDVCKEVRLSIFIGLSPTEIRRLSPTEIRRQGEDE